MFFNLFLNKYYNFTRLEDIFQLKNHFQFVWFSLVELNQAILAWSFQKRIDFLELLVYWIGFVYQYNHIR